MRSTAPDAIRIVATTGTNGKTSTTGFVRQLWQATGTPAGAYTSHGVIEPDGRTRPITRGTAEMLMPQLLTELADAGARAVALEAFAAALAVGMYEPVTIDVAIVTGITPDHLDVHGTFDDYVEAKLRVLDAVAPDGLVVVPIDAPHGTEIVAAATRRGLTCTRVGPGAATELTDRTDEADVVTGTLRMAGHDPVQMRTPIVDEPLLTNLLLAATAVVAAGTPLDATAAALADVELPPGRLEQIGHHNGARIVVDSGHNPDALRRALTAVRARADGRVIVVVGCGGDRDPSKRAPMGAVAAALADVTIITDDNPRREDPAAIRAAVRAGCPEAVEIPARVDAIVAALHMARPGDVVLLAGKGDERTQVVAGRSLPHDDRAVVRSLLGQLG